MPPSLLRSHSEVWFPSILCLRSPGRLSSGWQQSRSSFMSQLPTHHKRYPPLYPNNSQGSSHPYSYFLEPQCKSLRSMVPFNLGVYGVQVGWMAVLWVATITLLFYVPVAYPITRDTLNYTPIADGEFSSLLLLHGSPVQVYKQHALPLARIRRSMKAVENVPEYLFSPTSCLSAYASSFFAAAPLTPHPWASQTGAYLAYSPIHHPPHHPQSGFGNSFLHLDQNRGPTTQKNEDGTETDIRTGTGAKLECDRERIQQNSWKLSHPEGMNSSKVSEVYNTGIRMDLKLGQELEVEEVKVRKRHMLPLGKIRRLMKAVENVEMVSADSILLFSKACERFITELTAQSWTFVEESRETL